MSKLILGIALPVPLLLAAFVLLQLFGPGAGRPASGTPPPGRTQPAAAASPTTRPTAAPQPALPPTLAAPGSSSSSVLPKPSPAVVHEWVAVTNTGGVGGVVRADPVVGRQVAAPREGERLEVLGRATAGNGEWVHVRTTQGVEGWISGRIVEPTSPP